MKATDDPQYAEKSFPRSATDADVIAWARKAKSSANEVNLNCCIDVTDEGVKALAANCKELSWINLLGRNAPLLFQKYSSTYRAPHSR